MLKFSETRTYFSSRMLSYRTCFLTVYWSHSADDSGQHRDSNSQLSFSPDGRFLALSMVDNSTDIVRPYFIFVNIIILRIKMCSLVFFIVRAWESDSFLHPTSIMEAFVAKNLGLLLRYKQQQKKPPGVQPYPWSVCLRHRCCCRRNYRR